MFLTMDMSNLPPDVRQKVVRNLEREDLAQQAVAWAEQARIAKFYRDAMVTGAVKDGIGPLRSVTHLALKNLLAAHYGHGSVYQDPDFEKFILKKHDCFKIPDRGTRIQVGWTPAIN